MSDVRPRMWLVCYDIRDADRLRRMYRIMRAWGDHVQYSIFRCTLSERQLAELEGELHAVVHHDDDQVLLVPLGADTGGAWSKLRVIGQPVTQPERVCKVV